MKTLHVDAGRKMGGGQWQALYLVERLTDAVLLAPGDSPLFGESKKRGIDVRALSLIALGKLARSSDLIHAHDARAHTLAITLPGSKLVVSRRVAFPVKTGMLSRLKYGRANLYLAVSGYVGSQLEKAGVPREKIRVIYDAIPLAARSEGKEIVAIAKSPELVARISELAGVPIRFMTNLWDDLAAARILIYASELEGLGSAALAASSAGVPVIASNVGGLTEAVEQERTGILVPNRAEDFAAALQRLLKSPDLAQQMGRRGRERVEKEFTIEAMVQRTQAAYAEIVQ